MNAPFLRPAGCPHGIDPQEWRKAIAGRLEGLHDAMLALIAALDAMEADPECEPWLGSAESTPGRYWLGEHGDQTDWAKSASDEREDENEHGGDVQDEPPMVIPAKTTRTAGTRSRR